ncbi:MAG: class I SAM-dependent methyltransferase [Acidobacteria bacterium]|nr:class I SAM-dependent methyltransferase [Acidobacteriota bacterium]
MTRIGGLEADDPRIEMYLDLLLRWNTKVNLVSRRAEREKIRGELVAPLLRAVKIAGPLEGQLVDVGAGSGMGGVLFGLANEALRVSFVERVRKKAVFIKEACRALGLDMRTRVLDRDWESCTWAGMEVAYLYLRAVGGSAGIVRGMTPAMSSGSRVFLLEREEEERPSGWQVENAAAVGAGLFLRILRRETPPQAQAGTAFHVEH